MRRAVISATVLLTLSIQPIVEGCGDKLLVAGWIPRFSRVYAAVRPGNVVIYAPASAVGPSKELRDKRLHKGLRAAGHELTVASTLAELSSALGSGRIDVILSVQTLETALKPHAIAASSRPSVILLDERGDSDQEGAGANLPKTEIARTRSAGFYTAIEDMMKKRADAGLYHSRR